MRKPALKNMEPLYMSTIRRRVKRDMEMTGYFKLIDSDEGDLEINGDGDCDRNEDYVIDEGQPRATFRLDDSESEFKHLSIGEKAIQ
jgi:hypothetical protein